MNGSALAVNWADANIPSILEAWYPAREVAPPLRMLFLGIIILQASTCYIYKSVDQLPLLMIIL